MQRGRTRFPCSICELQIMRNTITIKTVLTGCLFLFLLATSGCNPNRPSLKTVTFDINEAFIGEAVTDSVAGITFAPPTNWDTAHDSLLTRVRDAESKETSTTPIKFTTSSMYYEQQKGGMLVISKLSLNGYTEKKVIEAYENNIKKSFAGRELHSEHYKKDSLELYQYTVSTQDVVLLKLLLINRNKQVIQMDYFMPKENMSVYLDQVESSIGTLKLL